MGGKYSNKVQIAKHTRLGESWRERKRTKMISYLERNVPKNSKYTREQKDFSKKLCTLMPLQTKKKTEGDTHLPHPLKHRQKKIRAAQSYKI